MTCDHHSVQYFEFSTHTKVLCSKCEHHWEEHPIQMGRDEYELWMVIFDLYMPRGHTPDEPTLTESEDTLPAALLEAWHLRRH